jgi:hypothetical protein
MRKIDFLFYQCGASRYSKAGMRQGVERVRESAKGRSMAQNRKCEGGRDKNADETH